MAESLKFKLTPARKKHLQNIAALGGNAKYKKYGHVSLDEQKRKRAWEKWWEGEGKLKSQKILQPVKIKKPNRSRELAEFVGIMIGDGGISEYFIAVTLNSNTDAKYAVFCVKAHRETIQSNSKSPSSKDIYCAGCYCAS